MSSTAENLIKTKPISSTSIKGELHCAAARGDLDAIETLIRAAKLKGMQEVSALLNETVDFKTFYDSMIAKKAILDSDGTAEKFAKKLDFLKDETLLTALHIAAACDQPNAYKFLVMTGTNVSTVTKPGGMLPCHIASQVASPRTLELTFKLDQAWLLDFRTRMLQIQETYKSDEATSPSSDAGDTKASQDYPAPKEDEGENWGVVEHESNTNVTTPSQAITPAYEAHVSEKSKLETEKNSSSNKLSAEKSKI